MDNPSAPPGKAHKYARVERERRWLMRTPPDPSTATAEVEITDVYFPTTRLRLRRMVDRRGEKPTVYKLTQKVPGTATDTLTTNTYLSETEYHLLSTLPGRKVRKVRYSVPPYGVDVFLPPLDGLVLAEGDLDEAPADAIEEVTGDLRYTGGYLAEFGWDRG